MSFLRSELDELQTKGLRRKLVCITGRQYAHVTIAGEDKILLCSNNYLGLASHPALTHAVSEAAENLGCGGCSSRLVSGTTEIHLELEEAISRFKGVESTLLFSSGYMANLGAISALCGKGDVIISDQFNHASLIDASKLSGAEVRVYDHCDLSRLESTLRDVKTKRRKMIVTDSVFSMDGDLAPIPAILDLAKEHDALLYVDDAHATGVVGPNGRGSLDHYRLVESGTWNHVIVMGTLSKALGSFGAFVGGSKELAEYLTNKARTFIFTTALPPTVCAAALAAIKLIESEGAKLRTALWGNVDHLKDAFKEMNFQTGGSTTQIIPIIIGKADDALAFDSQLFKEGVFVRAIRPPSVPDMTARLRITPMSTHTVQDMQLTVDAFAKIRAAAKE